MIHVAARSMLNPDQTVAPGRSAIRPTITANPRKSGSSPLSGLLSGAWPRCGWRWRYAALGTKKRARGRKSVSLAWPGGVGGSPTAYATCKRNRHRAAEAMSPHRTAASSAAEGIVTPSAAGKRAKG